MNQKHLQTLVINAAWRSSGIKQSDIAAQLGVTAGMVWQWVHGRRPVPADKAVVLAALLKVEPEDISEAYAIEEKAFVDRMAQEDADHHLGLALGQKDLVQGIAAETTSNHIAGASRARRVALFETSVTHVRFPLLEGFAGMGRGDYVGDYPEIVEFVEVTREWASQKLRGVPAEAIRVITGRGDSMRGQYNDGDLVFVDSRVKRFDADAAYCYRWNGRVQIKRLQLIGKGQVRILSENPKYPPIDVAIEELEIGGRALAAWTLTEF
jgi:phage repressor protein C with HTH and peptisase S24 domain/DNA-binding transcriptional regulator YdaS (Cro superfamily)